MWGDERGISVLRKYYALRDEVQNAMTESKRTWAVAPSLLAVQCGFSGTQL